MALTDTSVATPSMRCTSLRTASCRRLAPAAATCAAVGRYIVRVARVDAKTPIAAAGARPRASQNSMNREWRGYRVSGRGSIAAPAQSYAADNRCSLTKTAKTHTVIHVLQRDHSPARHP